MDIGKRIAELRERQGFSQNKLAEWSGVSQSHLRRVERNESNITVALLLHLCETLGITLKDFFDVPNDADEISTAIAALTPKQLRLLVSFLNSLRS